MKPFVPRNFTPSDNPEHLRIQACALNRLYNATESILHTYRAKDYNLSEKRLAALEKSVESEREMNAILTKEVEQLQADRQNCYDLAARNKKDYDDARERHWNTIQGVKEAADKLRSDLLMLRQSNNQPGWKEAIDAVSNILP